MQGVGGSGLMFSPCTLPCTLPCTFCCPAPLLYSLTGLAFPSSQLCFHFITSLPLYVLGPATHGMYLYLYLVLQDTTVVVTTQAPNTQLAKNNKVIGPGCRSLHNHHPPTTPIQPNLPTCTAVHCLSFSSVVDLPKARK